MSRLRLLRTCICISSPVLICSGCHRVAIKTRERRSRIESMRQVLLPQETKARNVSVQSFRRLYTTPVTVTAAVGVRGWLRILLLAVAAACGTPSPCCCWQASGASLLLPASTTFVFPYFRAKLPRGWKPVLHNYYCYTVYSQEVRQEDYR